MEAFFPPDADVVNATRTFFEGAAAHVEVTDFADTCPIATVALEVASTSEPMREVAAEAFRSWLDVLERRFAEAGMSSTRAAEVAVELFCAIEGAFLLSRTTRSREPILIAGRACAAVVEAACARGPRPLQRSPSTSYWWLETDGHVLPDVAWSYEQPLREAAEIRGRIAFFNGRVDVVVDGHQTPKPRTPWS